MKQLELLSLVIASGGVDGCGVAALLVRQHIRVLVTGEELVAEITLVFVVKVSRSDHDVVGKFLHILILLHLIDPTLNLVQYFTSDGLLVELLRGRVQLRQICQLSVIWCVVRGANLVLHEALVVHELRSVVLDLDVGSLVPLNIGQKIQVLQIVSLYLAIFPSQGLLDVVTLD